MRQVVPDYEHRTTPIDCCRMPGNDGYLQLVGIMRLSIGRSLLTPTTIRHVSRQEKYR